MPYSFHAYDHGFGLVWYLITDKVQLWWHYSKSLTEEWDLLLCIVSVSGICCCALPVSAGFVVVHCQCQRDLLLCIASVSGICGCALSVSPGQSRCNWSRHWPHHQQPLKSHLPGSHRARHCSSWWRKLRHSGSSYLWYFVWNTWLVLG